MAINNIIDGIIKVEGGYVNHKDDPGGATKYGITVAVARANGYNGDMRDLPLSVAYRIYYDKYVKAPNFHLIETIDPKIAEEVIDSGVNAGPARAARWLQEALNAFNRRGKDYRNIAVDGMVGPATIRALQAFKDRRGHESTRALLGALDALQGAHYLNLARNDSKFENFAFGWFAHRIRNVDHG